MGDIIETPTADSDVAPVILGDRKLKATYVSVTALAVGLLASLGTLIISSASVAVLGTLYLAYVGGVGTALGLFINGNVKSKALDAGVAKVP